jgi:glycosyltransferase involved in cell wall biosynthesis
MHIVIDMQGAQSALSVSGYRRHVIDLTQAIVRQKGTHRITLALSSLFPDTIEPIRAAFDEQLPQENICVWYSHKTAKEFDTNNARFRELDELMREAFLAGLQPDLIVLTNYFGGYVDDIVTSIGLVDSITPVCVLHSNLRCLLKPEKLTAHSENYHRNFQRKTEFLNRAALHLVMSSYSKEKDNESHGLFNGEMIFVGHGVESHSQQPTIKTEVEQQTALRLGITNHIFRKLYKRDSGHALQVQKISWDETAGQVIEALDRLASQNTSQITYVQPLENKRSLAFVSPLPPEKTGIADYSAALISSLAKHYDITAIVDQSSFDASSFEKKGVQVQNIEWFRKNKTKFDRVLYQTGNSPYHRHMIRLMKEIPGTVVLHDFYMNHLMKWQEVCAGIPHAWTRALYFSHGYWAAKDRYYDPDGAMKKYPVNAELIQFSNGVIAHSRHACDLAEKWYGKGTSKNWRIISSIKKISDSCDKLEIRKSYGFTENDFVICSFGFLTPLKLNHRLLNGWLNSSLARNKNCHLIFVGENDAGEYGTSLVQMIRRSKYANRIQITGYSSPEVFREYLLCADLAVQLRTDSHGETSAAVLDCMSHALPVIINAHGSLNEIDSDAVWMLPDQFDDTEIIRALERLWKSPELRRRLGEKAHSFISTYHNPEVCADRYTEAIESFSLRGDHYLISAIQSLSNHITASSDIELMNYASALSRNHPTSQLYKTIYLDISATCWHDAKTGIERLARSVTMALLEIPPEGYRIEPVYLTNEQGEWVYRHARKYTMGLLGVVDDSLVDDIIEPHNGDIILCLDITTKIVEASCTGFFKNFRDQGVLIYTIIFDLLPVQMPEVFPPGVYPIYHAWFDTVSNFDGAVCISKSVADDYADWLVENKKLFNERRPYHIGWFHLGADITDSVSLKELTPDLDLVINKLDSRLNFLMVGTIEPRKGHMKVLDAFDQLWNENVDVNLTIVGREGWIQLSDEMRRDIPTIIQRLRSHPELNNRLFWLDGISDEFLEKVYSSSSCLIAASFGEGFGLPIIEAAKHGVGVIARDLKVFREVAGNDALFFDDKSTETSLAFIIKKWKDQSNDKKNSSLKNRFTVKTWKESAASLLGKIIHRQWTYRLAQEGKLEKVGE